MSAPEVVPVEIRSTGCPVCGSPLDDPFVVVRDQPVHCNVLWPTAEEALAAPRGDMAMVLCRTCGHVHNAAFEPDRTTYGATYENSLHHSPTFQEYVTALVGDLVERYDIRGRDIVEIGAGQGDFLEILCAAGDNRGTGFDPSYVDAAPSTGPIRVVPAFYDEQQSHEPADVIVCRHVLEHIDRAGDFMAMVRRVIGDRDETLAVFEVPNAEWTFRRGGIWDLIYEHCGYFSPESLAWVFARNRFSVMRTDHVFGDQFLVIEAAPAAVDTELAPSHGAGVERLVADVGRFADEYHRRIATWSATLDELRRDRRTAVVWGAGSKGVTFLNVVASPDVVDRAVDINPRKHGMFVSGSGQPIVPPEDLNEQGTDAVIVMNPNYRGEVEQRLVELGVRAEVLVA